MKTIKLILTAAALGAALAAQAVTTLTVDRNAEGTGTSGTLQWALAQVNGKTSGEYLIKFASNVYGCTLKSSALVTSVGTKVMIDGTGSGVTIVKPGTHNVNAFFDISASTGSLTVSNVTVSAAYAQFVTNGSQNGKVAIVGCRFENGTSDGNGLVTQSGKGAFTLIERTTFINNAATNSSASAKGSCVNVTDGRLVLNLCSFIDNIAKSHGGVLYSTTTGNVVVANCSFVGNDSVNGNGDALYFSSPRDAWVVESLFVNQGGGTGSDIYTTTSYTNGITLAHCSCERLAIGNAPSVFNYTMRGVAVEDTSCEDVCGSAKPVFATKTVNGVRQTVLFPCATYTGLKGLYSFIHDAAYNENIWMQGWMYLMFKYYEVGYSIYGDASGGNRDTLDILGRSREPSSQYVAPAVGAATYYEETPSLVVTTLEDVGCGGDDEISFREAVRYAALHPELSVGGRAAITFAPSVAAQAVDGTLAIPVTEGDIVVDGELTNSTLVVAPPEGLRLDFCGKTNGTARVAAGRLFKLEENAKLELRDADVRNFQPIDGGGGALYLTGGNSVVVSNVCFSGNGVRGAGPSGGLYTDQGEAGGAIYAGPGTTLKVYGSAFDDNTAGRCGGAVCLAESSETAYAHFERTTFYSNKTQSKLDDEGGAVYAGGGRVVFVNTSFHKNKGHTAALQVRPGADVTMINAFVTESELVLNDNEEDEHGAAIYVENDETAVFRLVNSVVGGYRSQSDRDKGYCQLRILMSAPKFFVNSIVSANNDIWLAFGQEKTFVEYTEDELRDYVFGIVIANPVVHGVTHRFLTPKVGGALSGAGMEIRHNSDWTEVWACYGDATSRETMNVRGSSALTLSAEVLNTDIYDQDWSQDTLDEPGRQRAIGPIWGTNAAQARLNLDFHAQMTDSGWQITVPNETHLKYLPPTCGGHFVESVKLAADVSAFDPLCVKSARTVREYAVEAGNTSFKAAGGALYSADGRTFVALPPDYRLGGILVEAGVETVASNAFTSLSEELQYSAWGFTVELPDTLTTLEDGSFAGLDNVYLYLHGMTAPACTDDAFAECENVQVYVPYDSKGWDGDPDSTALPADNFWHGVLISHWNVREWPSLEVTTLEDVEDSADGLISLREAIDYAWRWPSLSSNGRAEITFAPDLPVNAETGKMELELTQGSLLTLSDERDLRGLTLVLAVPDGRMLSLDGSSEDQGHERCFYVVPGMRLELRNVEFRQFDCSDDEYESWYGGAIFMDCESSLVASNCSFCANGPASDVYDCENHEGGAVFVRGRCDARFYDCSFIGNQSGAGSAVSTESIDDAADAPFVLFERTSFANNRVHYSAYDRGGAVEASAMSRIVFDTCSMVNNTGCVSDVNIMNAADVTMVNSSVSDSVGLRSELDDVPGASIRVADDQNAVLRAVNCVFGGHGDAAERAKDSWSISAFVDDVDELDPEYRPAIELVNSIVSCPSTHPTSSAGVWDEYTEDDFTNYVYDVTAGNASASTFQIFRRTQTDAPKYFRPLGRESVLCGTGVTIYHDADWENIAWRYGDEEPHEFLGDAADAVIPVTRDILGNDWVGTLGLSSRQRNIGPLGAWDLAGDFEAAARAVPDYQASLVVAYDLREDCRIVISADRKFLPPVCGGRIVSKVEVGPAVTSVDPGWVASSPWVRGYVAVGNPVYSSMGGCLYTNTPNGKVFVAAPAFCADVVVQPGTCCIGVDAFRHVRQIFGVKLPASLRSIESGAFANCGCDIDLYAMTAPTYESDSFLGVDTFHTVSVPPGSTGWNGNPNSTELPSKWPHEDGVDGLGIRNYALEDYPSLVVTTGADVEPTDDGVTSLREAIMHLFWQSALYDNGKATVTFDPALAGPDGVIDVSVDDNLGPLQVEPYDESFSVAIVAPEGCRVRLHSAVGNTAETQLFVVGTVGGAITFSGLDIEGFSADYAAAIWSDWESTYIGELVISNCTFRNCWSESGDGGAVSLCAVKATVVDSVFEGNHQLDEDGAGGGLALRGCGWNDTAGAARIERCSFVGNYARKGGGLAIFGCENKDRMAVVNTSILGNETTGTGAAVWVGGLGTATFTHMSAFDNGSTYDGNALVQAVAHEIGTRVELVNSVIVSASYDKGTQPYVDRDVIFGSDEDLTTVRAANSVFGKSQKRGSAPSEIIVDCTLVLSDLADWFNPASTVTNVLTQLPMRARTPVAGGSATTKTLSATDVALDQLGLARTADFNAVGAIAADPACRPSPLSGYAAWVAAQGLTGANAEWNAKPARWGGKWANAFVYTFGEGIVDGTAILLDIAFDAEGDPVLTTAPIVEGRDDFNFQVIGAPVLDNWSEPVFLERNGNDWTLPAGESAHFFRVQLGR